MSDTLKNLPLVEIYTLERDLVIKPRAVDDLNEGICNLWYKDLNLRKKYEQSVNIMIILIIDL